MQQITITKRVAKSGKNAIVVIPKDLKNMIKPGSLVKIDFTILEEND